MQDIAIENRASSKPNALALLFFLSKNCKRGATSSLACIYKQGSYNMRAFLSVPVPSTRSDPFVANPKPN